jgi:hypothetical protein
MGMMGLHKQGSNSTDTFGGGIKDCGGCQTEQFTSHPIEDGSISIPIKINII